MKVYLLQDMCRGTSPNVIRRLLGIEEDASTNGTNAIFPWDQIPAFVSGIPDTTYEVVVLHPCDGVMLSGARDAISKAQEAHGFKVMEVGYAQLQKDLSSLKSPAGA